MTFSVEGSPLRMARKLHKPLKYTQARMKTKLGNQKDSWANENPQVLHVICS
jgi:hypothetical protein